MRKKVLIIKLGYCETLVNEKGFVPSLGDVFRHTVLLHHYEDYDVTWLTSESAAPLLKDNPLIKQLITFSPQTRETLRRRKFDEVLCLEKAETLCDLAKSIKAEKYLGFGWNHDAPHAHPGAESAMDIANGKDAFLSIQALLFQMVGDYWRGEKYVLGYKPKPLPKFDVGLNHMVGSKWPSKSWPMENWKKLEKLCKNHGLTVSWQEGQGDIYHYMDWINAGTSIVTCDSLGMHLGIAMSKKVVALFGPTPSESIYMYGKGIILTADWACNNAPCMMDVCNKNGNCMAQITPRIVARTINNILNGERFNK